MPDDASIWHRVSFVLITSSLRLLRSRRCGRWSCTWRLWGTWYSRCPRGPRRAGWLRRPRRPRYSWRLRRSRRLGCAWHRWGTWGTSAHSSHNLLRSRPTLGAFRCIWGVHEATDGALNIATGLNKFSAALDTYLCNRFVDLSACRTGIHLYFRRSEAHY
jgi:hypothetical protein